jgi:acetoin utilization deacetylase AcuC-like enzyme
MAYYATDNVTPIVSSLLEELTFDAAVIDMAVDTCLVSAPTGSNSDHRAVVYAITTHPGHHCSYDVFGGYCYLNNAALAAKLFQLRGPSIHKVAILDVDYHCGNGTASIFYEDPTVFVVSIHCDPDYDYPFNSGFSHQTGAKDGIGTTLHVPLKPGTTWQDAYQTELSRAMDSIVQFGPQALVVSLGLDTHDGDPVAIRRAGFHLAGRDYFHMGKVIGEKMGREIPILFVQEGGYKVRLHTCCTYDICSCLASVTMYTVQYPMVDGCSWPGGSIRRWRMRRISLRNTVSDATLDSF